MSTRLYIILLASCLMPVSYYSVAQIAKVSLEQALQQSHQNNSAARAARYDVAGQQTLKATATQVEKLSVTGMFGQYNSYATADNNITISQSIPFPSVFAARSSLSNAHIRSSELKRDAIENNIAYQVKSAWYHLAYLHALNKWYIRQDSLLQAFAEASSVRHRTGETTLLEKVTAESRHLLGKTLLLQNEADIAIARKRLQTLMNSATPVDAQIETLTPRALPVADSMAVLDNPQLRWYRQQITVAEKNKSVEKNLMAPDLTVGYFNQTLIGTPLAENSTALATGSDRFHGFQVGVSMPLWFRPQAARVRAAEYNRLSSEAQYEQERMNYKGELTAISQEVEKLNTSLKYYVETALPQAELILRQANLAFRGGDISYVEFSQALTTSADLRARHLETLNNYNQAVITLEYLLAQK